MDYQYCDTCHASDETVQLWKNDEVLCFKCWGASEGRNEKRRNRGLVMNVDSEISSAAIFESDREEWEKEPVVEELLRKMKALCNTDMSQSERPVEDNEDNESEDETDDNNKNMHKNKTLWRLTQQLKAAMMNLCQKHEAVFTKETSQTVKMAAKMDVESVASVL